MTTRDIELVPHDPAWARLFAEEKGALESALSRWLTGPVEHIGSTSVPGLAAKPIVDMMAPVRNLGEAVAAIPAVVSLGYAHSVHRPAEAHYFFKPVVENWWERTHQLHLTEPTTVLWLRRIAFRDALREREDHRSRYEQLKRDLAAAHGSDVARYSRNKDDFVNEVLGTAHIDDVPRTADRRP